MKSYGRLIKCPSLPRRRLRLSTLWMSNLGCRFQQLEQLFWNCIVYTSVQCIVHTPSQVIEGKVTDWRGKFGFMSSDQMEGKIFLHRFLQILSIFLSCTQWKIIVLTFSKSKFSARTLLRVGSWQGLEPLLISR